MNYAQEIKERLTSREVFEYYGLRPNRSGFVCCPFHHEDTPSMKIYDGKNGYCCFGCGETGDIFDFVRKYFNLNFHQAIEKINSDFCLGFPIGEKMNLRQRLEAARKSFELNREREHEREAHNFRLQAYYDALGEFIRLDRQKRLYAPKNGDTELNALFIDALQNFELSKYRLECAETELFLYDQSKHAG